MFKISFKGTLLKCSGLIRLNVNVTLNVTYATQGKYTNYRRGRIDVERSPRMREIGVRSPVALDLSRKNR